MFLGVILVCGLTLSPMAPEGCAPMTSNRLFMTERECVYSFEQNREFLESQIPDGTRVTPMCLKLEEQTDT